MTPANELNRFNYEFGPYRLALEERRLYREGEVVLLPPKEFDLLLLLVRNSGQILDRESLLKALWPNTVVEEANLNVHISALRKALAESSSEPRYIETLPRRGYRFVAPVIQIEEPEKIAVGASGEASALALGHSSSELRPAQSVTSAPAPVTVSAELADASSLPEPAAASVAAAPEPKDWYARHRIAAVTLPLWVLALALVGILIFLFVRSGQKNNENAAPQPLNVLPLTTYPGRESQPAFSPDGNQVAFVWDGEDGLNNDIYVRLVDGGNAVRLTSHPGDDVNPVWSPDGGSIAFYRSTTDGDGVFLVPSLGGAERKLTDTWANWFGFGSHSWLHWSPDGKWLVLSDKTKADEPFELFLVSPETGERRRLTLPPAATIGDCSPAFSPDGQHLAFVRVSSAVVGEVYLTSLQGGEPRRLTFEGAGVSNLVWTLGGRELVFTSRHSGKSRLLRVSLDGGQPSLLAVSTGDVQYPAYSAQGSRLAWRQNSDHTDIFRVPLKGGAGAKPLLADLIASTANEVSPRYSPDGKRVVFVSNRSGSDEIWVCDSEGKNSIRLTSFRGPLAGSPSWSPDGRQIVFDCRPDGNADIYVINSNGGQPRRLTTEASEDIVPSWSHDGRWIYFTSNRSGRLQVWKMPADGGQAEQMTKQGGFEPIASADGAWLYFTQDRGSSAIWRLPVAGGEESLLFDFHQKSQSRMWAIGQDGIYFAVTESPVRSAIKFYQFGSGAIRTIVESESVLPGGVTGLALSPDGKWLLYPQIMQRGSDLMMVENFR